MSGTGGTGGFDGPAPSVSAGANLVAATGTGGSGGFD
jgi:hypothetical protein